MVLINLFIFILFFSGISVVFIVFAGYPFFLLILSAKGKKPRFCPGKTDGEHQTLSILVVFRNAETLIEKKIENFLKLDYPPDKKELVLVSDGTSDDSKQAAELSAYGNVRFFHFDRHQGKAECLNFGVSRCKGDIILFSDVDALLDPQVPAVFSRYFNDPGIGGVCGRRVVAEKHVNIRSGQLKYIQWDTMIKNLEMKNGLSITSHDGKIYAVRKELYTPVPPGVTDDAYVSLSITASHHRFVFESAALAYIKTPSRNARHELSRRKRIVSTSLNGLKLNRKLLNPFKYGLFSIGLFINKILRRLLPFALLGILVSSYALALQNYSPALFIFMLQVVLYCYSMLYPLFESVKIESTLVYSWLEWIKKSSSLGFFFCIGMAGTFWGVVSFLSGEKIEKWDPVKK